LGGDAVGAVGDKTWGDEGCAERGPRAEEMACHDGVWWIAEGIGRGKRCLIGRRDGSYKERRGGFVRVSCRC